MSPTQWQSHDLRSWLLLLLDFSGGICSAPREEVGISDPTLFHCLSPPFLATYLGLLWPSCCENFGNRDKVLLVISSGLGGRDIDRYCLLKLEFLSETSTQVNLGFLTSPQNFKMIKENV